ncbi:MAG: hypothetical protein EB127_18905 [Alphaproteobacteria bacterium]|nr:hypothetical protein [Alphaproteobacteria bacterium]
MIYEYLIEQLALTILETRLLSEGGHRRGTGGVVTIPGAKTGVSIRSLRKLNPSNPAVHSGIPTVLVVRGGKVVRIPKTDKRDNDILAEAYLSKYSYRTPRETMASRVTVDPKTGEEKSAKTFSAKMDANADLAKLEGLKARVKETGKPHEVTFIGKRGPQLQPQKHREVEHKLEIRMHMGEPHVFHKGIKVQLRATGNGIHIVAPGEKNDRIVAHTGMLSSPHFGGAATRRVIQTGRSVEQRTQKQAERRKRVAKKVAKKRKLSSEVRAKAAAVQGKAKKLTPPAPAPEGSRIADIMKRMNKG